MNEQDEVRLLALADEYEAGLRKMELSGYEEFDVARKNHQLVIDALRAQATAPRARSSAAMDDMRDPEVASAMREEAALIPVAPPSRLDAGSVEAIARIIDPSLFADYDAVAKEGTVAANGRPWAEVVYGKKIAALYEKANAIIALSPSSNGKSATENEG